jgi:hypothetical protein
MLLGAAKLLSQSFPRGSSQTIVAGAVGSRLMAKTQRLWGEDRPCHAAVEDLLVGLTKILSTGKFFNVGYPV